MGRGELLSTLGRGINEREFATGSRMKGQCLCRRVSVEIANAPEYINVCNCQFCRKLGAAWGYFRAEQVSIEGETREFRRDDLDEVWLAGHFCPNCGTTTHYTVVHPSNDRDRMAVNTRVFEQAELDGIEVRYLDGRSVDEDTPFERTATGRIGDGSAF